MENTLNNISKSVIVQYSDREKIIANHPFFVLLPPQDIKELALLLEEKNISPSTIIVQENDIIDYIYLIVSGKATVTKLVQKVDEEIYSLQVGVLGAGNAIGISNDGFFATDNKRTATVIADTDMYLLYMSVEKFDEFIQNRANLYPAVHKVAEKILRINFLKKLQVFSRLKFNEVEWLVDNIEEKILPAQTIVFVKGEPGNECYLIKQGKIALFLPNNPEHFTAILEPPNIFGEAAILTDNNVRNASAKAIEDSVLLVIKREYLYDLEQFREFTTALNQIIYVRSIPIPINTITVRQQTAVDDTIDFILHDTQTKKTLRLSQLEWKLWQLIDGKTTITDIVKNYVLKNSGNEEVIRGQFKAFLLKLNELQFVTGLKIQEVGFFHKLIKRIFYKKEYY
jgi:CRP-like cAMP-binding protein